MSGMAAACESFCDFIVVKKEDIAAPVWVFGELFEFNGDELSPEYSKFLAKFSSILWFTYRSGFTRIGWTTIQTDTHWGCMLRCGQMILAEAMMRVRCQAVPRREKHLMDVLRFFVDDPGSLFSIHNISLKGKIVHKQVGEWFGPNMVVQVLRALAAETHEPFELTFHIAMDGVFCLKPFRDLKAAVPFKPVLVLIPLRLGFSNFDPLYASALKRVFKLPQSLGAVGGKPNAAFYFVGIKGESLIYLDPHTTQRSVDLNTIGPSLPSFFCSRPLYMAITSADPSICLGFLCLSPADIDSIISSFVQWQELDAKHPLFSLTELPMTDFDFEETEKEGDRFEEKKEYDDDDDGFEIL